MKRKSSLLNVVRQMPELAHSFPYREFEVMDSEVCEWLAAQPEIRQWLYEIARSRNLIVFNPERRTWKGSKTK